MLKMLFFVVHEIVFGIGHNGAAIYCHYGANDIILGVPVVSEEMSIVTRRLLNCSIFCRNLIYFY